MCNSKRTIFKLKLITTNTLFQTLLVKNKESFKNLPPVQGMLSYREDNEKLYVKKGNKWDEISSEKEASVFKNSFTRNR